ncbi:MAG: hypothetical protein JWN70_1299 [Planctomycetaceae bacterium]|nr:hypothetical protein [Planctomycetaceae bacterium]
MTSLDVVRAYRFSRIARAAGSRPRFLEIGRFDSVSDGKYETANFEKS